MVMTTDVQLSFLAGALFADLGADAIRSAADRSAADRESLYSTYRFRAMAYPALVVGPSATVFMLGWPGWESQYWSARLEMTAGNPANGAVYGGFLILLVLGGWLGNRLGFRWVLSGARRRLRAVCLVIALLTVAVVALGWPAPVRLGSFSGFRENPASLPYVWQDRAFFAWFWAISAYCVLPLAAWFRKVRSDARR